MGESDVETRPSEGKGGRGKLLARIALALVIVALVAAFFALDLGRYVNFSYIKASQTRFAEVYAGHPLAVIAVYMAIYILVAALSLPGAAVLTLLGGALFGVVTGVVAVSFASTIGATLACIVARFLLRDMMARRLSGFMGKINAGVEREGAWYLFGLRLVPVFPFWLVNLAMALTSMKLSTFTWVSQLGMLPATIVFVNAGSELARISSLRSILSPGLLISFAILGVFPIAAKKTLDFVKKRRAEKADPKAGQGAKQ
ncbi:MAG: TVP38/TMEM64 family protein [Thermodesulfobacteriota bacterium]